MATRKLAAIMFTDIVGYTAIMQADENKGREKAKQYRAVLEKQVALHDGEVVQNYGDGSLSVFHSAVEAVRCAEAVQLALAGDGAVPLRVGIHLGDIVIDGGELYGDGINVASRIESMGIAGSVLLSSSVHHEIQNQPGFKLKSLGNFDFKNVKEPLEVFALENLGLKVPKPGDLKGKFKDKPARTSPVVYLAAALAMLLFGWAVYYYVSNSEKPEHFKTLESIAVLPLEFQTDQVESYLKDELYEGLINRLGQLPGLKVISLRSTNAYADSLDKTSIDIAGELAVDGILKGSIRSENDSLNIKLELIQMFPNQQQIWSNQYSCGINDLLNVQRDVVLQIAGAIKVDLSPNQHLQLVSNSEIEAETYKAYLRGMFFINGSTPEEHAKGMDYLHEAVSFDPANPLAYLGLAKGYIVLGHGPNPDDDVWSRAKAAAIQAIKLDSTLSEAYTVLAILKFYRDMDWEEAEHYFKRTLEMNPNQALAHFQYAWFLAVFGRFGDAIIHHRLAKELDPLVPLYTSDLGSLYYWAGESHLALQEAKEGLELDPKFGHGWWVLGNVYVGMGLFDKAIEAHQKASAIHPIWKGALASTYALSGDKTKALEVLSEYKQQELSPRAAFWLAHTYMTLGNFDSTFYWLDYKPPDPWIVSIRSWPEFRLLHHDSRFNALMRELGLPPV